MKSMIRSLVRLEARFARLKIPILVAAAVMGVAGAGAALITARSTTPQANLRVDRPDRARGHHVDDPAPPPGIESTSLPPQASPALPFSGPKKGRGTTGPQTKAPADDFISLGSGLPMIRQSFTAEMLPAAEWLSLLDPSFDCWTDDSLMKRASVIFEASQPGMLKVEAALPHLWSVELTDPNESYGSEKFYITGSIALYSDDAARLVLPLEAGRRVRISGCNYGSLQTSIEIAYEFDPNRVIDSPRNTAAGLTNITPNQLTRLREAVPVNFVFLGFDENQIDLQGFLEKLPKRSQPVVRIPYFYGLKHSLGIEYTYRYRTTFSGAGYEDRFFDYMKMIGEPANITAYQRAYNDQNTTGLPNTSSKTPRRTIQTNFVIDATKVEKWLAANPPGGIDTREYTVYFINWFGREGFTDHVFSHLGEIDPDVGRDFGKEDTGKVIAWGGTPPDDPETGLGALRRVWFYDFSAGPDWRTGNWNLSTADRIPPIWEYHEQGAKKPSELTFDLAKIARYVAIDLLFTPSPLYPPGLTPPPPPRINSDRPENL